MKKVIYFLLVLFLFSVPALAFDYREIDFKQKNDPNQHPLLLAGMILQKFATAGGDDCPGGLYAKAWDGDESTGSTYYCVSGGSATVFDADGGTTEIGTSYGDTGNGLQVTDSNEYRAITISNAGVGTVWFKIDMTQVIGSMDANFQFMSVWYDTDNFIQLRMRTSGNLQIRYIGAATLDGDRQYAISFTPGTFEIVAFSWDNTAGDGSEGLALYSDGAWRVDESGLSLTSFASNPTQLQIGSAANSPGLTDDVYYFDDVAYIETFKAANPW
jgi:hypothetical protein